MRQGDQAPAEAAPTREQAEDVTASTGAQPQAEAAGAQEQAQAEAAPANALAGNRPAGTSSPFGGGETQHDQQRAGSGGSAVPSEVGVPFGQPGERGQDRGIGQHGEATNRAPSAYSLDREPVRRQGLDLPKSHNEMPNLRSAKGWPDFYDSALVYPKTFGFREVLFSDVHVEVGVMTSPTRN